MKLKIEKLYVNEKDKNGNLFVSKKTGQAFKKISVWANGQWYSGFQSKWNSDWKIGDEVEVEVESKSHNGQTFNNIKSPQSAGGGVMSEKIDQIIRTQDLILGELKRLQQLQQGITADLPEEDLPF